MTKVINLFGGPGCGKSTLAAELYYRMKRADLSVELVREYVKDWAWQGRPVGEHDQLYILAKQARSETMLYGKVDYIVTDSPVLLSGVYEAYYQSDNICLQVATDLMSKSDVTYHNYVLQRYKQYKQEGRYETEDQARNIDTFIIDVLDEENLPYTHLALPDDQKADKILTDIGAL